MSQDQKSDRYQVKDLSQGRPLQLLLFNARTLALRYDLIDTANPEQRLRGEIRGIGLPQGQHRLEGRGFERQETLPFSDHRAALDHALAWLTNARVGELDVTTLAAVGHQVLYGSAKYGSAVVIDDTVRAELNDIAFDCGEHIARLRALDLARERILNVPHVAVFDTAYFQNLPEVAQLYALPYRYFKEKGLRRYGFFGLSHKFAAFQAAAFLDRPVEKIKLLTVHLGNGTSLAAIDHGRPVDTSMGLTPMEGPPMAVRSGAAIVSDAHRRP